MQLRHLVKNKYIVNYFLNIMKKAVIIISCMCLLVSCRSEQTCLKDIKKEYITYQNIGNAHNYLLELGQLKQRYDVFIGKPKVDYTVNDYIQEYVKILLNNDKYYSDNAIITRSIQSMEEFPSFINLKIDKNFHENIRTILLAHLDCNPEVKGIIEQFTDIRNTITQREVYDAIKNYHGNEDRELLMVFENILKASSKYWETKESRYSTRTSVYDEKNKRVIWADAIGGILGSTCTPWMGLLWGAACSHAMDDINDSEK